MILTPDLLIVALMGGLGGAARALLAAWSKRGGVDHKLLAKNIILGFAVGAGMAATGLPEAAVVSVLAGWAIPNAVERAVGGAHSRYKGTIIEEVADEVDILKAKLEEANVKLSAAQGEVKTLAETIDELTLKEG